MAHKNLKATVPTAPPLTIPVTDAARRLGLSRESIRRLVKDGDLRGLRVFGRWEVAEADIRKIEEQRAALG